MLTPERRAELERRVADTGRALAADPTDEDAWIWHGRALAYLGRYRDAIDAYGRGLARLPASYRLLRHRGHRWLTLRDFERAEADLGRGVELARGTVDRIEPDGQPNARGIPRSTDHSNLWYHLALARYLRGNFAGAAAAWERCLEAAKYNDDQRVAASWWLYLARRRSGAEAAARDLLATITPAMDVIENHGYHRLLLAWQRDEVAALAAAPGSVDSATLGYGLAMNLLLRGERAAALEAFTRLVAGGPPAAFGVIAAEVECQRLGDPGRR